MADGTAWTQANPLGFADSSKGNGAAMRSGASRTDTTLPSCRVSHRPRERDEAPALTGDWGLKL